MRQRSNGLADGGRRLPRRVRKDRVACPLKLLLLGVERRLHTLAGIREFVRHVETERPECDLIPGPQMDSGTARIENADRREYRMGLRFRLTGIGPDLRRRRGDANAVAKSGRCRCCRALRVYIREDGLRMPRAARALEDAGVPGFAGGIVAVHDGNTSRRKGQNLARSEVVHRATS